ncbi:MAG TPA: RNase adapter RapZ [Actinocrinis sp.]|nr:RNase adapter RapZ [Actinocrinis sp.]
MPQTPPQDQPATPSAPEVLITTYGVLHGQPPSAQRPQALIEIDLRTALRNPHEDPGMRFLTGLDQAVYEHVRATAGAEQIMRDALGDILRELDRADALFDHGNALVEVHVFCQGGRHRSVSMGRWLQAELLPMGISVQLVHRDIDKDVVQP